jgi:hypothetical protein
VPSKQLHTAGTFTNVLNELYGVVRPKYLAVGAPTTEGLELDGLGSSISYVASSSRHRSKADEYEEALQQWGCRFRLTHDLTETGKPFPLILEFGRSWCEGRLFFAPREPSRRPPVPTMPPPGGWVIAEPDPRGENFSQWVERIKPQLRSWYGAVRERQRSKSYPNPAKRASRHYEWFVLSICRQKTARAIADDLAVRVVEDTFRIGEDTIRKGINAVRRDLSLSRK